jgi:alpha-tubulin suppressor-like RCC1 family protein
MRIARCGDAGAAGHVSRREGIAVLITPQRSSHSARWVSAGAIRDLAAALLGITAVTWILAATALGNHASQPTSAEAGGLDVGKFHSCARLQGFGASAPLRCWGYGGDGALGYGNTATIGDDETPAAAGPVALGADNAAIGVSSGAVHTCALLDDASVRCWGFSGNGRLGYPGAGAIGDDEHPGDAGPIAVGGPVRSISAGRGHTCAVLASDAMVRCWGFGSDGRLGYGNVRDIGDDEAPASAGAVDLGAGRTALSVSAGEHHTCALTQDLRALCWGFGGNGELGYGNTSNVGDDETPADVPVTVGSGRSDFAAISAGAFYTCAILSEPNEGQVRCWGFSGNGRLGTGQSNLFVSTPSDNASIVDLAGKARAISTGDAHACALLENGSVRCWGFGQDGRLGYGNETTIGDDEAPASVAPVDIGAGRTAIAISAGFAHTCARLDDASIRCWGAGSLGRLGICTASPIGDDETPASVAPLDLGTPGAPRAVCGFAPTPPPVAGPTTSTPSPATAAARLPAKLRVERARVRNGRIDALVLITTRATGVLRVRYRAARRSLSFTQAIGRRGVIRISRRLTRVQARLETGILELSYSGNDHVRPDSVRLRAARHPARLIRTVARIDAGRLLVVGTIARAARGNVRVRLEYADAGETKVLRYRAPISRGRWRLARQLPAAARTGGHLSMQYTGYMPARVAGGQTAKQLSPRS